LEISDLLVSAHTHSVMETHHFKHAVHTYLLIYFTKLQNNSVIVVTPVLTLTYFNDFFVYIT